MIVGSTHIRAATLEEFDQIAHLISDAHQASGEVSDYYDTSSVRIRLNEAWAIGSDILVVEVDGAFLACGVLMPARFARNTWTLCLGATRRDMQGRGIGHMLVHRRLQMAIGYGAGSILVSSKNAARWNRYGFKPVSINPITGASLMVINTDWRA
jgi:N-acetylglutamate synthase-like GNAT family acetyltransferase